MKKAITTDRAPRAIGPYSQAVDCGDFVFLSGQIAIDPATGKLEGGDAAAQTRRVMENLGAVLAAAGLDFKNVVKTTVYLASLDDFQAVGAVYGEYFPEDPPARATVEVSRLPLGALVEIEAVAKR